MYLLDTDHISLIDRGGPEGEHIRAHLTAVPEGEVAASIISYEEQMRGWLAFIHSLHIGHHRFCLKHSPYRKVARW